MLEWVCVGRIVCTVFSLGWVLGCCRGSTVLGCLTLTVLVVVILVLCQL